MALDKTLTNNKPLKDADREDGRKLVAFFEGRGLKSATIRKKIGWLTAAVKLEMDNKEPRLKFNPFSGVVPRRDDKDDRLPLDSADMKAIRGGLGGLAKSDQVLLRLLASTGLRLGEAFQINSEATERGCRYVVIGSKTAQSRRRVPLPAAVLPFLPKSIRGPLFNGGAPAASKRLNRFLPTLGSMIAARWCIRSGIGPRIDCAPQAARWTCNTNCWAMRIPRSRPATAKAHRCRCCVSGSIRSAAKEAIAHGPIIAGTGCDFVLGRCVMPFPPSSGAVAENLCGAALGDDAHVSIPIIP